MTARALSRGFADGFAEGMLAGPLAAADPLALWLAHVLLRFEVPAWAYVAVWLMAFNVIADRLARARERTNA